MTVIGFHGDPCVRCITEGGINGHVQAATHHGMCARHWLGASERQRRDALFDEAITSDTPAVPRFTTEVVALELLFGLPAVEPRGWAA